MNHDSNIYCMNAVRLLPLVGRQPTGPLEGRTREKLCRSNRQSVIEISVELASTSPKAALSRTDIELYCQLLPSQRSHFGFTALVARSPIRFAGTPSGCIQVMQCRAR